MDPPRRASLPTPTSDSSSEARGQKRKRVETRRANNEDNEDLEEDEAKFNRFFDPNQDPEERRQIKRKSRALERQFQGKHLLQEYQASRY